MPRARSEESGPLSCQRPSEKDGYDGPTNQRTPRSSTSKTKVALGGITPPAPVEPALSGSNNSILTWTLPPDFQLETAPNRLTVDLQKLVPTLPEVCRCIFHSGSV